MLSINTDDKKKEQEEGDVYEEKVIGKFPFDVGFKRTDTGKTIAVVHSSDQPAGMSHTSTNLQPGDEIISLNGDSVAGYTLAGFEEMLRLVDENNITYRRPSRLRRGTSSKYISPLDHNFVVMLF